MATILCPGKFWKYKWNNNAPTTENTVDAGGEVIASLTNDGGDVVFRCTFTPTDKCLLFYDLSASDEGEVSIVEDNMVVSNVMSSLPPSYFKNCDLYLEDVNGCVATFSLNNDMVGKRNIFLTDALVCDKDFNKSYVSRIGFRFNQKKAPAVAGEFKNFTFRVIDMHTVYRVQPQYVDPQDVIDFLGIRDNKGSPFILTDSSNPTYNTVATRVVEAEQYVEGQTRMAWTEKRVVDEYRNADLSCNMSGGYYGLYAPSLGGNAGAQVFFTGIPIKLIHDYIQPIDYSKGDSVSVRVWGAQWQLVPNNMVWSDETKGILMVRSTCFQKDTSVKVTYRYGKGPAPADIRQAVILKTAMILLGTDWYRQKFPQSPMFGPMKQETVTSWTWALKDILRNYTNTIATGGL